MRRRSVVISGRMLQAFSVMAFVSVPVAIVWSEFYAVPALLVTGAIPLGIGRLLVGRFGEAGTPNKLHGMTIAAS